MIDGRAPIFAIASAYAIRTHIVSVYKGTYDNLCQYKEILSIVSSRGLYVHYGRCIFHAIINLYFGALDLVIGKHALITTSN